MKIQIIVHHISAHSKAVELFLLITFPLSKVESVNTEGDQINLIGNSFLIISHYFISLNDMVLTGA